MALPDDSLTTILVPIISSVLFLMASVSYVCQVRYMAAALRSHWTSGDALPFQANSGVGCVRDRYETTIVSFGLPSSTDLNAATTYT